MRARCLRHPDPHTGAASDLALERNAAAVQINASLHDGESQSRAGDRPNVRRALEKLKQLRNIHLRNTNPLVGDLEQELVLLQSHSDANIPVEGRVFQRVAQEVGENVRDQALVEVRNVSTWIKLDRN